MTDINRIKKELRECKKDGPVWADLIDETNLLCWEGTIEGPSGTPYEGGVFRINITLPSEYPFVPPKMKFVTRVWHPNISSESGAICLDILKNEWSPALTIRTALISLQALLSAAEPDDPQDAVVAKQYKADYKQFCGTAKFWTETYAMVKKDQGGDSALKELVEMGFDEALCKAALTKAGGDKDRAMDALLGGA